VFLIYCYYNRLYIGGIAIKRLLAVILALFLALIVNLPVFAAVPGAAAGNYYYTDIVTYLWNTPVNSINVGGLTLIDAESMLHYGFAVNWHDNERLLEIVMENETVSPEAENGSLLDMKTGKTGSAAGKYYHTDIKATLDGEPIISYNIGGRTFISAEAMRDIGYDVIWDSYGRALSISMDYLRPTWSWSFVDGTGTALNNGFSLEFENITRDEGVEFSITEATGEYQSVGMLVLGDKSLVLTVYMTVNEYGDFWDIMFSNRNIIYGDREYEDTPERRADLSRAFRVYANGDELGGEMSYTQGNGSVYYAFIYDEALPLESVKTMRLELGYK